MVLHCQSTAKAQLHSALQRVVIGRVGNEQMASSDQLLGLRQFPYPSPHPHPLDTLSSTPILWPGSAVLGCIPCWRQNTFYSSSSPPSFSLTLSLSLSLSLFTPYTACECTEAKMALWDRFLETSLEKGGRRRGRWKRRRRGSERERMMNMLCPMHVLF